MLHVKKRHEVVERRRLSLLLHCREEASLIHTSVADVVLAPKIGTLVKTILHNHIFWFFMSYKLELLRFSLATKLDKKLMQNSSVLSIMNQIRRGRCRKSRRVAA